MISTVVFDFDGTLVDSNAIKIQGFYALVSGDAGGAARMARIIDRLKVDRKEIFRAYVAQAAREGIEQPDDAESLLRRYNERIDEAVAAAREIPGATQLLQQLREHCYRVFLSSATPIANLRYILGRRSWLEYFDDVFGHPTSKTESVIQIRQRTGVDAASLAFVGDGADDRACAAAVGCVFFPVGEARGASAPEKVFTLTELAQALLGRAA
jgi:phosphoglycolate phosphatase